MFYNLAGLKSAPTRDEFLTQRMNYNFMGEDMKIVMVVSESAAYIKAGGLGDVIHSLAKALIKLGHSLYIIMPKYSKIKASLKGVGQGKVFFDGNWQEFSIYEDIKDHVRYYFIDFPKILSERTHIRHTKGRV